MPTLPQVLPDSFCHWYVNGAVPVAVTLKLTDCPALTVWRAGCVVMLGAVTAGFTVSVAALVVALPALLVNTARYWLPLWLVLVVNV